MDSAELFVLRDHNGYAIELPISGPNDPNFAKVIRTFEYMVKDIGKLGDYHKNPFDYSSSEEEFGRYFNKYYRPGRKVAALFYVRHTDEMYKTMEAFVQVVNICFQKEIFL